MTLCESTLEGASSMMLSFAFRILSHLIFWLDLSFLLIFVNCCLCCKLTILCSLFFALFFMYFYVCHIHYTIMYLSKCTTFV